MKDSLWSMDLFQCESILLKSHWVLVVMDQFTRRIIGFGIHPGDVDGVALCRMFNTAISTPGYQTVTGFFRHQLLRELRIRLGQGENRADGLKSLLLYQLS